MENRMTDVANEAKKTIVPEQLLEHLLNFEPTPAPVISLYLDARADQQGQHNFLPFVRKQLNARSKTYENHSKARVSFEEDFVRITRYLEGQVPASVQGLAIFACSAMNDWFEVGQFDAPFERNRLFVSDRPHLYPLARLIDQYRHYAVVLADTNRAQIFVFAAGRAVDRQAVESVKTKHAKVGGWSQARYQRHEQNYHLQHAKEVAGDEPNNWCRQLALTAAREGPLFGKTGRLIYTELAVLRFLIGNGLRILLSRNEGEAAAWTRYTAQADQKAEEIVAELLSRRT